MSTTYSYEQVAYDQKLDKTRVSKTPTALIINASSVNRKILQKQLLLMGVKVFVADIEMCIQLFDIQTPDIIIFDLNSFNKTIIESIKYFKKQSDKNFIPVLFIAELDDTDNLVDFINCGGDDFIIKPFQPELLHAKIKSLLRIKNLQDSVIKEKEETAINHANKIKDMYDADGIIFNIHKDLFYSPKNLQWAFLAQDILSGDMISSALGPAGKHVIMVADNTGHGLSASIGSLLSYQLFYTMVNKGFDLAVIIEQLNQKLYNLLPVDRFLAACFITIDYEMKVIKIWNAGLPDVIITDNNGVLKHKINSIHMPLGISSINKFDITPVRIDLNIGDYIYCYTDGLTESFNPQGEMFGQDRLLKSIAEGKTQKGKFKKIFEKLKIFRSNQSLHDDVALVQVCCDESFLKTTKKQNVIHDTREPIDWKLTFEFSANSIRNIDPIPIIVHTMTDIQGLQSHREKLYLILSEMYSNALEHGVLKLDSKIKNEENGFLKYYELRESLLKEMVDGKITINIEHIHKDNKGIICILVEDNGDGFDFITVNSQLEDNKNEFGRGLALLSNLCRKYNHFNEGRQLQVEYEWKFLERKA